jgi:selenocysteine lyase/cysteine desulfurase
MVSRRDGLGRRHISLRSPALGSSVKLAVFSHISSVPAVILPVKALTALCHIIQTLL